MALEIKILDYGDIELESSFLVLGRDCGRTRRLHGTHHRLSHRAVAIRHQDAAAAHRHHECASLSVVHQLSPFRHREQRGVAARVQHQPHHGAVAEL